MQLNFELEKEILSFGNRIKVIAPEKLKRRIKDILDQALDQYQYDFSTAALHNNVLKLTHRGFCILRHVFAKKGSESDEERPSYVFFKSSGQTEDAYAVRHLFREIPELKSLALNQNLIKIVEGDSARPVSDESDLL